MIIDDKEMLWVFRESSHSQNEIPGRQDFLNFWEDCKNQVAADEHEKNELDGQLVEFRDEAVGLHSAIGQFREVVKRITIVAAIGDWVRGLCLNSSWGEKHFPNVMRLQQQGLLPYKGIDGKSLTLEYFVRNGHQDVLENIRCVNLWSVTEKEGVMQTYITFSRELSLKTYGLIPSGSDPDRDRVRNRSVKYELFLDFVQQLPTRDALIAKLLYFGAPSIEGVLSLKKSSIDKNASIVTFSEGYIVYSKHVVNDLLSFVADREVDQLVFTNFKDAEMDRVHVNQSFTRACEKLPAGTKITPAGLLKSESTSWHGEKMRK